LQKRMGTVCDVCEVDDMMFFFMTFCWIFCWIFCITKVRVKLDSLFDGKEHDQWHTLEKSRDGDTVSGEIKLTMKLEVEASSQRRGTTQIFLPEHPLFVAIRTR
jgi:hypothetical protein